MVNRTVITVFQKSKPFFILGFRKPLIVQLHTEADILQKPLKTLDWSWPSANVENHYCDNSDNEEIHAYQYNITWTKSKHIGGLIQVNRHSQEKYVWQLNKGLTDNLSVLEITELMQP